MAALLCVGHLDARVSNDAEPQEITLETSIYPNPAEDFFYIKTKKSIAKVTVHNIIGKEVLSYKANDEHRYGIHDLQKGLYVVRMFDSSDKLIKALRLSKQ